MRTRLIGHAILGILLIGAVMTLVALLVRATHPEWPNWAYPVFGVIVGFVPALLVSIWWTGSISRSLESGRPRNVIVLETGAICFTVLTFGAAYQASQAGGPFPRTILDAELPAARDGHDDPGESLALSPAERQLHARAVRGIKQGASAWLKRLEDSGAHGPAGATPDFLDIETRAERVRVSNRAQGTVRVALARSGPEAGPREEDVCPYRSARGPTYVEIPAGAAAEFLPGPACVDPSGKLEIRVGDPFLDDPLGWWSDSAISRWRRTHEG